ncbi:MAG: helix-turn-helix domain-containing protein [Myxococcota bacterium]
MLVPNRVIRQVARRIAELRQRAGLTQQALAERLGVGWRYVARIERGLNLTLSSLTRIANALGVPIRRLLDPPRADSLKTRTGRPKKKRPQVRR